MHAVESDFEMLPERAKMLMNIFFTRLHDSIRSRGRRLADTSHSAVNINWQKGCRFLGYNAVCFGEGPTGIAVRPSSGAVVLHAPRVRHRSWQLQEFQDFATCCSRILLASIWTDLPATWHGTLATTRRKDFMCMCVHIDTNIQRERRKSVGMRMLTKH